MAMIDRPVLELVNTNMELPTPPVYFTEAHIVKYKSLGNKLITLGMLKPTDMEAFFILVDNLVGYEQAATEVARDGVLVDGREGTRVRNPATIARNACWSNLQPLLVQFGLTPSARSSMGIGADSAVDPLETLGHIPSQGEVNGKRLP